MTPSNTEGERPSEVTTAEPAAQVIIIVDDRESRSDVPGRLAAIPGIKVLQQRLEVGDYDLGADVLVERKTVSDFVDGIEDSRLFDQATHLRLTAGRPIIVLEGDLTRSRSQRISMDNRRAAALFLARNWNISVIQTKDAGDTAEWLAVLAGQVQRPSKNPALRTHKPKDARAQELYVLQGLPGVGEAKAAALLSKFGNLAAIFSAPEPELAQVIGPKLGKKLASCFRGAT